MKESTRVLLALGAAVAAGTAIAATRSASLLHAADLLTPIGTLWVNAIRMTVVPLVVSLLITGIASCSTMQVVRGIGWRALVSFLDLLIFVAALGLLVVPPLFAWFHMAPATIAAGGASHFPREEFSPALADSI